MAIFSQVLREAGIRRGLLFRSKKKASTTKAVVYAASVEFAHLGFQVNVEDLSTVSERELTEMLAAARKVVGGDRAMKPVYPGFPEQVASLATLTLYLEQIRHYWTAGEFLPNYPELPRDVLPFKDAVRNFRELKVVEAAAAARFFQKEMVLAPLALSPMDRQLLEHAVAHQRPARALISELLGEAKNGENKLVYLSALLEHGKYTRDELLELSFKTARNPQQLLQAFYLLAGPKQSPSAVATLSPLLRKGSLTSLPRSLRRLFVERLGELTGGFYADDLVVHRELWQRALRSIHSFELASTEASKRALAIAHENIAYSTFNSQVEVALSKGQLGKFIKLMETQPGNFLRRLVAILHRVETKSDLDLLAQAVESIGAKSTLSTLISAYNGVLIAKDGHQRIVKVPNANNFILQPEQRTLKVSYQKRILKALKNAMETKLASIPLPEEPLGVESSIPVVLVERDMAFADRLLKRRETFGLAEEGDTLRIFGHWNNNMKNGGYMDIGAVILDASYEKLDVCTWDSWSGSRSWGTYSGDKYVEPGHSAAEYVDVNLEVLRKEFPKARYIIMTIQSWSGFPIKDVDFLAGAMLRSKAQAGEVFDPRTLATAFRPTTSSLQAIPFLVDVETMEFVWLDTSNGSKKTGVSSSYDNTLGPITYDALERPYFTYGELASLWAKSQNGSTKSEPAELEVLTELLNHG